MIIKEIKEYSQRLRINIVQADGFNPGDKVVVIPVQEYEDLNQNISDLQGRLRSVKNDNEILKQRQQAFNEAIKESEKQLDTELEKLLEVSLKPINETHEKQLEDKDSQIEQLTDKLNGMQSAFHHFTTKINSLNAIDIIFRKKHNEVISDFIDSITITGKENNMLNADVKQITEKKDSHQ